MRSTARLAVVSILPATLALAVAATPASAEHFVLSKNFTPHPLVTKEIKRRTGDVYFSDRGWRKCGGGQTTKDPIITFDLKSSMPEMLVRLETRSGSSAHQNYVIVTPDKKFICSQKGSQVYFKNWPKGRYKVWISSRSIGQGGIFRFEVPSRSKAAVKNALAKLPTIDINAAGPNPRFNKIMPTQMADARDLRIGCDTKKRQRIMPLAKLKTDKAGSYYVGIDNASTFIVTADNKCAGKLSRLSAGVHTLWLRVPHATKPKPMILETDARDRRRDFADAEIKPVGDLSEPMVIPGKVRKSQWWGSRRGNCRAARTPDFLLRSTKLVQNVKMSLLWGRKRQRLHVFGPLEEMKATSSPKCDSSYGRLTHKFDIFEGTYAVWVGDNKQDSGVGGKYNILLRRADAKMDPLKVLAPVPAKLDMFERSYANHYPFFSQSPKNWERLFTAAPKQLFVFARVEVKSGKRTTIVGEPLVMSRAGRDQSTVVHYDGHRSTIKTKLLTTNWPETVVMPTKPVFESVTRTSTAIKYAGPEDNKAVASFEKTRARYTKCFRRYMSKNDPTFGKGHELYKISGSGRVTNVGDQIAKRADRKCGAGRVDRAEKKLIKRLNKTRKKRLAGHLKAVRARFGL